MAGFGDLALAFAGGAAKQINDDADAARDAKHKQQTRAKELRLAQKLRMEETAYTKRMEEWQTDNINEEKLAQAKATGDPHLFARTLAEVQGRDPNEQARLQRNGMKVPIMPWKRRTDRARPTVPNYMPVEDQEKTVNSAAKIARVFNVKEEELKEVPRTEEEIKSGKPVIYEMPENYDWSGYMDPAKSDEGQVVVGEDGKIRVVSKKTGNQIGSSIDSGTTDKKPGTNFSTIANDKGEEIIVATPYLAGYDADGNPTVALGESKEVGEKAAKGSAKRKSQDKARKDFREETSIVSEVLNAGEQLSKYRSAEQSGVPGAVDSMVAFFDRQIESFTGSKITDEGVQRTTLAAKMVADFNPKDKAVAREFFEKRMAIGKAELYETILLYKSAKMLKPEGKLNVDDIERMESLVKAGKGEGKQAGVVNGLMSEARVKGITQSRAYAQTMEHKNARDFQFVNNPEKGIRGWAYYYDDENGVKRPHLVN